MEYKDLIEKYQEHKEEIKNKLRNFSQINHEDHIKELFFCILTPQSNAEKCWQAVKELERCRTEDKIKECLKTKTRFYKNKAKYLTEAGKNWREIRKIIEIENPIEARNMLAESVKGLGMKEASHFLRNIGKSKNQLAILDRHVLRQLEKIGVINEMKLNKKRYLEIEDKMRAFSEKAGIPLDELDLLFWKIESGRIFK